ncbi:MAG: HEAT repeat domain-containing protein, partial [Candidatus Kariarchaeaceae archaeon]
MGYYDIILKMFWKKKRSLEEILLDRTGDYKDRSQAALDISTSKESKYFDPLVDAMLNDPEPAVRMNAAFALGELRFSKAKTALMQAIADDGSEWVRGHAASSLTKLNVDFKDIEELMIRMLDEDRDAGARRHYAHSLGMIGSPMKAGPILLSILRNDLDEGVRADAAEALGILGYQEAYEAVDSAAKNDISNDVRRQAMVAK